MVLAIGIVVDDAIVVVEAVSTRSITSAFAHSRPQKGLVRGGRPHCGHLPGAHRACFCLGLHEGTTGRLYQQFAVTVAVPCGHSA